MTRIAMILCLIFLSACTGGLSEEEKAVVTGEVSNGISKQYNIGNVIANVTDLSNEEVFYGICGEAVTDLGVVGFVALAYKNDLEKYRRGLQPNIIQTESFKSTDGLNVQVPRVHFGAVRSDPSYEDAKSLLRTMENHAHCRVPDHL